MNRLILSITKFFTFFLKRKDKTSKKTKKGDSKDKIYPLW